MRSNQRSNDDQEFFSAPISNLSYTRKEVGVLLNSWDLAVVSSKFLHYFAGLLSSLTMEDSGSLYRVYISQIGRNT